MCLDIRYPQAFTVNTPHFRGCKPLKDIADYLKDWKEARNAVPGLTYGRKLLRVIKHSEGVAKVEKVLYTYKKNKFFNPCIWVTINRILHEIAHYAVRCGAVYIATDGYIIRGNPEHRGAMQFTEILEKCGLNYRHYFGEAQILKWGAYEIDGYNVDTGEIEKRGTDTFYEMIWQQTHNPPQNQKEGAKC